MDRIYAGLLGPTTNYGGILDSTAEQQARQQAMMATGANLLGNSGWTSTPTSLSQAVGQASSAGRAAQAQGLNDALQAQLLKSQMARNERVGAGNDGVGNYNPRDYTAESWAEFVKGEMKDPSVLKRFEHTQRTPTPSFKTVTRTLPDGSTELGTFDTRTNQFSWTGQIVPAGQKAFVEAQATAAGTAAGGQDAKAPALASFQVAADNMRQSIGTAMQGMVAGPAGTIFDYGDKKLFNSRIQQLSAEIRTVFRIPGEGTLSDQEQRQYSMQLPDTDNPPEVNAQIMADLEQRVALRMQTPIGSAPAQQPVAPRPANKPAPAGKKKTAAERAAAMGL